MKTRSYGRTGKLLLGVVAMVSLATLTNAFAQEASSKKWESRPTVDDAKSWAGHALPGTAAAQTEGNIPKLRDSRPDTLPVIPSVLSPKDAAKNPPTPETRPEPVAQAPPRPPVQRPDRISTQVAKQEQPPKVEGLPPPEKVVAPIPEGYPITGYCCGGSPGNCVPGRLHCCSACDGSTFLGRVFCGFYESLCCPDPCYEPRWIAQANSAMFVESPRPITHTRIRWDYGDNFTFPDTAEFFWAKIGGKGPAAPAPTQIRYHDLTLYQEVAAGAAGVSIEIPYRSNDPGSGFADMVVGTKAMLFDQEILQVTFMFRTFIPIGKSAKGLGTGHVSLEPSLLSALKLTPNTYLQSQISEWIPIGGDPAHSGSILHYHFALNQVLFRPIEDVSLIGSVEFMGYSFQDGQFTLPAGGVNDANGIGWFYVGPGVRFVVCDKVDLGFGAAFALDRHGPEQIYRTEFRFRF